MPAGPPPGYEWDAETALERIKDISVNARTTWFGLLGLMTFVLVTLLGVQDIDFFGYGRLTQLPLVNVDVPTELFFWAGPPLAAATYAYFHFYLLRLWDALGRAPAKVGDDPFSEHVFPWLLTDMALRRRRDGAARRRALGSAARLTSVLITWVFGIVVLTFAWWRSMVAHDVWLSLWLLASLLLALAAGITSWIMLHRRIQRRIPGPQARHVWRGWRRRGGFRVAALLIFATVFKTWLGHPGVRFEYPAFDEENVRITASSTFLWEAIDVTRPREWRGFTLPEFNFPKNTMMANADLADASITIRPDDWRDHHLAELEARKNWCDRRDLTWALCAPPPVALHDLKQRNDWCKEHLEGKSAAACTRHFSEQEFRFQNEWSQRRDAYLAILKKPDLGGRDLRGANMDNAFLVGVDLEEARFEGAYFGEARLERANLLRARLEGADLVGARLEGANLFQARLEGADLGGARLEGANLRSANLKSANLGSATFGASLLNSADFTGATRLKQSQIEQAIGDEDTILPDGLYVWDCWEQKPETWDQIVKNFFSFTQTAEEALLCNGHARQKTGRPAEP